jgi:hypothetical protein
MIKMMQGDCMELMARTPDKYYELAIVDNTKKRRTRRPGYGEKIFIFFVDKLI